jgi:hypothetical protein
VPSLTEEAEQHEGDKRTNGEDLEVRENGNDCDLVYHGRDIRTAEQLLEHAEVDLRLWEVVEQSINKWEVAGKRKHGQNEAGRWNAETLWKTGLLQIKVKLRRRAPKAVQDAIQGLLAGWKPRPFVRPKRVVIDDAYMLDVALHDAHFGKLCWALETGTDYDLKIVEDDYCRAIDDMLVLVAHYGIERIQMVVGSDIFQVDNLLGTTTKGTRVDSVDERLSKVFDVTFRCVDYGVRRFRSIADVDVFWIPGNHDYTTSWFLCRCLWQEYHDDPHVTVDCSPSPRKYRTYGPTLLGYDHGDECKLDKLPLIMATDVPNLWAQSTYRRWCTGDKHRRAKYKYTGADTHNGVEVFIHPSLSGTDLWHFRKGYVNNIRMAECFLYSKHSGPVGQFTVTARSERT